MDHYRFMQYKSDDGYVGTMHGRGEFFICDLKGHMVFHTSSRTFHTYEELKKHVDEFPEFLRTLQNIGE